MGGIIINNPVTAAGLAPVLAPLMAGNGLQASGSTLQLGGNLSAAVNITDTANHGFTFGYMFVNDVSMTLKAFNGRVYATLSDIGSGSGLQLQSSATGSTRSFLLGNYGILFSTPDGVSGFYIETNSGLSLQNVLGQEIMLITDGSAAFTRGADAFPVFNAAAGAGSQVQIGALANSNANAFLQAGGAGVITDVAALTQQAEAAYTGTITWTGTTAPSGTPTNTYKWVKTGNAVTLLITLVYTVAGVGLTAVTLVLPSTAPAPKIPSGITTGSTTINALVFTAASAQGGGAGQDNVGYMQYDSGVARIHASILATMLTATFTITYFTA